MSKQLPKIVASTILAALPLTCFALPIDWHGTFGVDTTILNDYRRVSTTSVGGGVDSQEVASSGKSSLSWQSYVFKLAPSIVINDAATFYSEMTTGYAYGGFLGDSTRTSYKSDSSNNNQNSGQLYIHNQAAGETINLKKAYLELSSDTATYVIGRHTYNWALGAIYNGGQGSWDRHAYSRDGITMKLKINNFHVHPFWSKTSNGGNGTPTSTLNDTSTAKEMGVALLYDNPEKDIAFGMLYGKKSSSANNAFYKTAITQGAATTTTPIGEAEVTVTDIYFKKIFGKFDLAAEVPLFSGDLGNLMNTGNKTTFSAKALLLQSNFRSSDNWTIGLDAGQVSGQDGSLTKFSAVYLNPNYQVSNILFRYNLNAPADVNQSIYDGSVTNARYLKARSSYKSEKWIFDTSVLYAKAVDYAKAGEKFYNHTKYKMSTGVATVAQSDDLGTEIDFNSTYQWNNELSVGTNLGYLITGDYFGFTNAVANPTKNSLLIQLNTAIKF